MSFKDVTALILAAGTSTRMGQTKQLLNLSRVPILEWVIRSALQVNFTEILVVIGHEAKQIKNSIHITDQRFRWVYNSNYLSGQSTSLQRGLKELKSSSVMVFLGDMPFIKRQTIRDIFQFGFNYSSILKEPFVVRPKYRSIVGHPVYIGHITQLSLSELKGDQGAKYIIKNMDNQYFIPTQDHGSSFDLDTLQNYEEAQHLLKYQKNGLIKLCNYS